MNAHQQEIAAPKACKRKSSHTKTIVYLATFVAISLVLKVISNQLSFAMPFGVKLSINYLSWFLSAAAMGPLGGGVVAALSDVMGQLILPQGSGINPFVMAGNALGAFTFGMIFKYLPTKNIYLKAVAAALGFALVGTLGLNSLGLWLYYYKAMPYGTYLLTMRLPQLGILAINITVFCVLHPVLKRMRLLEIEPADAHDKPRQQPQSHTKQHADAAPQNGK